MSILKVKKWRGKSCDLKNLSFSTIIHLFLITFLLPMYSYYLVVTIFVLKRIRMAITLFYTFFWWSGNQTVFLESFVAFWLILCNLDKKFWSNVKIKWRHAFLKKRAMWVPLLTLETVFKKIKSAKLERYISNTLHCLNLI